MMPSLQCWLVVASLAWLTPHLALELDVANMEIPDEKGDNSDSADNSGDCFGSDNFKSVTSNQLLIVNIIHHETAELQGMSSNIGLICCSISARELTLLWSRSCLGGEGTAN